MEGRGRARLTCLVVVEGDGGDALVALVALRCVWKEEQRLKVDKGSRRNLTVQVRGRGRSQSLTSCRLVIGGEVQVLLLQLLLLLLLLRLLLLLLHGLTVLLGSGLRHTLMREEPGQLKRLLLIGSFPSQPAQSDSANLIGVGGGGGGSGDGGLGHRGRAGAPLGFTPRLLLLPLLGGLAARSLLLGPLPVLLLLLLGDVLKASLDAPGAAAG